MDLDERIEEFRNSLPEKKREAHVVMCNWGIGIADLQGILGMLRLKSLLFGVVSVRM